MFYLVKSAKAILVALICFCVLIFSVQASAAPEDAKKITPILFLLLLNDERSARPIINPVATDDISITGAGEAGSLISLSVAGTALTCGNSVVDGDGSGGVFVDETGAWNCDIFESIALIEEGTIIKATQKEQGKLESRPTTTIVQLAEVEESLPPTMNSVKEGDLIITGEGVSGAIITLTSDGDLLACTNAPVTVDMAGAWSCNIATTEAEGAVIDAIATETGKSPSTAVTVTVQASIIASCEYTLDTPTLLGEANAETATGSWPDDSEPSPSESFDLDSEGNCLSPTLSGFSDHYVSFYEFTVATESSFRLRLSSATVSPQVFVIDESGNNVGQGDADDEVVLELNNLESGTYTIEATTFVELDEGDYTLTLERKTF